MTIPGTTRTTIRHPRRPPEIGSLIGAALALLLLLGLPGPAGAGRGTHRPSPAPQPKPKPKPKPKPPPPRRGGPGPYGPARHGPLEILRGGKGGAFTVVTLPRSQVIAAPDPYRPAPASGADRRGCTLHGDLGRSGRQRANLHPGTFTLAFRLRGLGLDVAGAMLACAERSLEDSQRWLLQGETQWPRLATRARSPGPSTLDPDRGAVYLPLELFENNGFGGVDLATRKLAFRELLSTGMSTETRLLARVGPTYLAVVSDLSRHPHGGAPSPLTVVTAFAAGQKLGHRPLDAWRSARVTLRLDRSQVLAGLQGESLVLAGGSSIVRVAVTPMPVGLKVRAIHEGAFDVFSLSVDEAGRAHLLVRVADRSELWVVDARGRRWLRARFPRWIVPLQPPVIGFDHRVFLIERDRITAIETTGSVAWIHEDKAIVGAGITPDGTLIVAATRELFALGPTGIRRVLHTLGDDPDERLDTAPVITRDGTVLLGSNRALIGLRATPQTPAPTR